MSKFFPKTILFLLLFSFISKAFSQESNPKAPFRNTIYGEVFGQGLFNSLSFDRLYRLEKKNKTSLTLGLTLFPSRDQFVTGTSASYNYLVGEERHHLELGLGITALFLRQKNIMVNGTLDSNNMYTFNYKGHSDDFTSFFTTKVGYRYQKPEGGFFFRLTFAPPIALYNVIGKMKGGSEEIIDKSEKQVFKNAALFSKRIYPWGGFSFGWTLKR